MSSLPPFLKPGESGVYLSVKLQPRASKNQIGEVMGNELKISVTAPPVDSAANQALIEFLAERLRCAKREVEIVKGNTSRHKTIFISGKTWQEIAATLS